MDTNLSKPVYIHSFHFDTGTKRITIIASEEKAQTGETIILALDALPQSERTAFLGIINNVLPQSVRRQAIWRPQPSAEGTLDENL